MWSLGENNSGRGTSQCKDPMEGRNPALRERPREP